MNKTPEQIAERELDKLQAQKQTLEASIAHCEREVAKYTAHKTAFEAKLVEVEAKILELT